MDDLDELAAAARSSPRRPARRAAAGCAPGVAFTMFALILAGALIGVYMLKPAWLPPGLVSALKDPGAAQAIGGIAGAVLLFLLAFAIWWLPVSIAKRRDHPSLDAIRLLVVLSLICWGIAWIIALVWALAVPHPSRRRR